MESSSAPKHKQEEPITPPADDEPNAKKRKRDGLDESDPKLREFLEVMDPGRAPKRARDDDVMAAAVRDDVPQPPIPEDESDDEYEDIPAKISKPPVSPVVDQSRSDDTTAPLAEPAPPEPQAPPDAEEEELRNAGATDDEWLRSRTNRLLDLVDPDDPHFAAQKPPASAPQSQIPAASTGPNEETAEEPTTVLEDPDPRPARVQDGETPADVIERTRRLFVRNLPYNATEDDLRAHFGAYGSLEEVSKGVKTSSPNFFVFLPQSL